MCRGRKKQLDRELLTPFGFLRVCAAVGRDRQHILLTPLRIRGRILVHKEIEKEKTTRKRGFLKNCNKKKLMTRFELVTPSLPRKCSTPEPHQLVLRAADSMTIPRYVTLVKYFFEKNQKFCVALK